MNDLDQQNLNADQNMEQVNDERGSMRFTHAHGVTANELDQLHPGEIRSIIDRIP